MMKFLFSTKRSIKWLSLSSQPKFNRCLHQKFSPGNFKMMVAVVAIGVMALLTGCAKKTFQTVYPTLSDGRYDSEFPYRNCSKELDDVSRTVKKLYCLVEYDTYTFDLEDQLLEDMIRSGSFKKRDATRGFFSESVHGTATVILSDANRIVVLTCAHVVDYPDTIYSYFYDSYGQESEYVESIAIKRKQMNFIRDLPGEGLLDIIVMDLDIDIAFLGNSQEDYSHIPSFNYPAGKAKNLEWGSFVYVLGYPAGYQMVTRGIVSNPNPGGKGEFLVDALFNTGVSGGIVLAVRDGVPNFELVGVAKSVSAKYKNVLRPHKQSHEEIYNANVPYYGEIYVKLEKDINYGVTFAVTIESVEKMYQRNRRKFLRAGYMLDDFFRKENKN